MKRIIFLVISGICIGIANVIPGVSGGTAALVLGIYQELLDAIKSIRLKFLVPLGCGVVIAILIFSRIIPYFLENFTAETYAFFLGLVIASVKIPYQQMEKRNLKELIFAILGFIIAWYVVSMQQFNFSISPFFLFICGFISISAMILPGISGAYILMVMGQYKTMLEAVRDMNLTLIVPFMLGIIIGIMIFSWILSFLLRKYHSITMAALIGLMLGSLKTILPGRFDLLVFLTFVAGFGIVLFLEYIAKKY